MCEILKEVLDFLTMRGRVNFGIMSNIPREAFLNKQYFKVCAAMNVFVFCGAEDLGKVFYERKTLITLENETKGAR